MNARLGLVLLSTLGICAVGCGDPTELMLIIKAAPGLSFGAGGDINALRVSIQPASGEPQVFTYTRSVALCGLTEQGQADCRPQRYVDPDYDKSLTLPVRLLLQPGNVDQDELVRVWIDAQLGSKVLIANGLKFRFSPGRRLWLELPLYRECLGVLACQTEDKICGIDQACSDARPTTEAPPDVDLETNDLAGLLNVVDAAQACGMPGMQCCQGEACFAGAACNPQGYCIDPTVSCGQQGQTCCAQGMACVGALVCDGSICDTSCGDTGQACCAGTPSCNKGSDKCIGGSCQACGEVGEQCCPGPSCTEVDAICDNTNHCVGCGSTGQLCCDNDICFSGACGLASNDMAQPSLDGARPIDFSQPFDLSPPQDFGPMIFDFSVGDGFATIPGDGGAASAIEPLGGGVPLGPPRYCL